MPDLIETVEHGVAILTLNRPENLNALSDDIRNRLVGSAAAFRSRRFHRVHHPDWRGTRLLCGRRC